MKRILFVCLGNICRSSSAEEVMRTLIKKKGLEHEIEVDSAGILSYHRGELPDSRMRMHASRRGYNLTHRPRPVFHYGGTELVKYLRGSICHDSDYSPCFP
jgi:protein-tyrosine phosphatase